MTLMDQALRYGGLTTLSDSYAINGEPGDFYDCSKGTIVFTKAQEEIIELLLLNSILFSSD
jgi:hypothetical protein